MSAPLVMLWLAALPCEHVSGEREPLTRMTGQAPELLDAYLQEVEARWDGLSLRSPGEDSNARKVEAALQRLEAACAGLEEARAIPVPQRSAIRRGCRASSHGPSSRSPGSARAMSSSVCCGC